MILDLMLSDEQELVQDSTGGFLADRLPLERLREEANWQADAEILVWDELTELGLFGLGVEESRGGIGMSLAEEVIVAQALGEQLVSPLVLATMVAAHLGDAGEYAAGRRASFATPVRRGKYGERIEVHLLDSKASEDIVLLLPDRAMLFDRSALADLTPVATMDETVGFERATLDHAAARLSVEGSRLFEQAELLISSCLAGIAQQACNMAVAYAGMREQFGQPIGAFQAVKHSCAEMARRAEAALCQTRLATAQSLADTPDSSAIACARLLAGDGAIENAKANIQVHGGMGFTFEANAHLLLKRAHLLVSLNGNRAQLLQRIIGEEE
ncbi:MAG: acyl-CoA/acyl-ACP dehydrogenase [Novosphingobium sp.]|nr:acyl-CoA/acyl-ACP dehydrogenase [Novosphingobium sp.]